MVSFRVLKLNYIFKVAACRIERLLVVKFANFMFVLNGTSVSHPPILLACDAAVFLADRPKDSHCFGFMMSLVLKL